MSELTLNSGSRIKSIGITDNNGNVIVTAKFNPSDFDVYTKFTELQERETKERQAYEELRKKYKEMPEVDEDDELSSEDYEKLYDKYSVEREINGAIDKMFGSIKIGVDEIFGEGVYDALAQGCKDMGMIKPLFEWAAPLFTEAAKEYNEQIEKAQQNREQRRAAKKAKQSA